MAKIERALLSLTDKTGAVEFARGLRALDIDLISTGGTAKLLQDAGIPVFDVSAVTHFPEMLDGRVKTLHPAIHGGILAMRSKPEHLEALEQHAIPTIDLVCVNLYAFEKIAANPHATTEELIENIDIGGPTMIRAAAKNYQDVAIVVEPADYPAILAELNANQGHILPDTHWRLAVKAFHHTAAYDRAVSNRLALIGAPPSPLPATLDLRVPKVLDMRYGENPHQAAALYAAGKSGVAGGEQLHGKELSYNNLVDLDAAWQLVCEFARPASVIVKHTNPCGCAEQATLVESYRRAFEADPVSAFGGVLAFNRPVDADTAAEISKTFIEAIAAPGFTPEALELLTAKKNLRLVQVQPVTDQYVVKSISGGFLVQTPDLAGLDRATARVVTDRQPTEAEWAALAFGWKVVKHVKSNAIVYANDGQLLSAGAGQMSRVFSVEIGAKKSVLPLAGSIVASDAFFPFPDGLEAAAQHGITAAIQPGGSVKDAEVIAAANRLGLAMVFSGFRHFRH
ncbi:MAG: bifunctional phosphoribosylaminoimidazolecarboxamide formyltransferase/IMP cyclohydrolase [Acidobacteriaceae bacterium]|jgi:phosphoribosylaminoimidazolecarboxamide formyltransferase/IMP cyclohydrolase|nr:bifunctional phosphoribosylaminoimidazolecarboxamide formyltransferase/IMP cyclohydrolase [Acidobacteriaceae bacterium]